MALRLLELVLSQANQETKDRLLETFPCGGRWEISLSEDKVLTTVLLDAERVEPLIDELAKRYSSDTSFRVVLLPVEATAPKIDDHNPKDGIPHELDLPSSRISREELYQDVLDASSVTPIFVWSVILSTIVAAAGFLMDSAPAIIGAMVIAPLLGPNAGLALAAVLADVSLAWRSLKANLTGFALALGLSYAIGAWRGLESVGSELSARSVAGVADMAIALAAGVAGIIAFTSPVSTSLIGVMVAVALLPPTVACGMLAGAGLWAEAGGAFLLVAINVTCINLASVATFVVQGVRPNTWYEAKRGRQASIIAIAIWVGVLVLLGTLVTVSFEIDAEPVGLMEPTAESQQQ